MDWRLVCSVVVLLLAVLVVLDVTFDDEEDAPAPPGSDTSDTRTKTNDAVNEGYVHFRKQTPDMVQEPSALATFDWQPPYEVSPEELAAFDRDGYAHVRGALDPRAIDILFKDAQSYCQGQLTSRGVCQIEQIRWQSNSFRDFMLHGPLGRLVHSFMRANGVRIQTEALFSVQFRDPDPEFFSYQYHSDTPSNTGGVYHGFPTGTPGVSVWFPLHDLDADTEGGSIKIVPGYSSTHCKYFQCGGVVHPTPKTAPPIVCQDCHVANDWNTCHHSKGCKHHRREKAFTFRKGDIVLWHSDMPHATQPIIANNFTRFAVTVRTVDSDAILCNLGICGQWMACCKDLPRQAGLKVHSHCFPRIHPSTLKHEVDAHYSPTPFVPKHLMASDEDMQRLGGIPRSPECT